MLFGIGSMYGIDANIWGILMVHVTIYSIHGSYGFGIFLNISSSQRYHVFFREAAWFLDYCGIHATAWATRSNAASCRGENPTMDGLMVF
jgi:hypothetical protein